MQGRTVQWGRINPLEARDFLIRQGLVEGEIQQRFAHDEFIDANRSVIEEAQEESNRTRQVAQTVSDEDLYDFYNEVIPNTVTCVADLAKWWKGEFEAHPHLLDFDPSKVERLLDQESVSMEDFPDHWVAVGSDERVIELRLSYVYDTHDPADGVTVHIPLGVLSRISAPQFSWNVPGLRHELIVAMIKALPKALRVQFVPAPDTATKIEDWIDSHFQTDPGSGTLDSPAQVDGGVWPDFAHVFTQAAIEVVGAQIHPEVLDGLADKLPPYLRMNFVIEQPKPRPKRAHRRRSYDDGVVVLGTGKSLVELQRQFAEQAQESARKIVHRQAQKAAEQGQVVAEADLLRKAGATTEAREEMLWRGALDRLRLPAERISSRWLGAEALMLASAPYSTTKALADNLQLQTVKRLLPDIAKLSSDEALSEAVDGVKEVFEDAVYEVAKDAIEVLRAYAQVDKAVSGKADLAHALGAAVGARTYRHTRASRFHRRHAARFIPQTAGLPAGRHDSDSPRRKPTRTAMCAGRGRPTKPNKSSTKRSKRHARSRPGPSTTSSWPRRSRHAGCSRSSTCRSGRKSSALLTPVSVQRIQKALR